MEWDIFVSKVKAARSNMSAWKAKIKVVNEMYTKKILMTMPRAMSIRIHRQGTHNCKIEYWEYDPKSRGYQLISSTYSNNLLAPDKEINALIDEIWTKILAAKQYEAQENDSYYKDMKPLQFKKAQFKKTGSGKWARVVRTVLVVSARIEGVIAIGKNNKCVDNIHDPNAQVWYKCDCASPNGATFTILYDGGDRWHPASRYGTTRANFNMKPKKSVDLSNMSTLDRDLLKEAARLFQEEETNG